MTGTDIFIMLVSVFGAVVFILSAISEFRAEIDIKD